MRQMKRLWPMLTKWSWLCGDNVFDPSHTFLPVAHFQRCYKWHKAHSYVSIWISGVRFKHFLQTAVLRAETDGYKPETRPTVRGTRVLNAVVGFNARRATCTGSILFWVGRLSFAWKLYGPAIFFRRHKTVFCCKLLRHYDDRRASWRVNTLRMTRHTTADWTFAESTFSFETHDVRHCGHVVQFRSFTRLALADEIMLTIVLHFDW